MVLKRLMANGSLVLLLVRFSLTPLTTNTQMSGKRQFPKLGEYYAKMLAHCPQAITAYGACIKAAIDAGALEQGCCEREFSALKKCFREVRVKR